MSDEDIALDEKRVHAERRPPTRIHLASALGLATVSVSDDQVGRFGLTRGGDARDVAATSERIAVAIADTVVLGPPEDLVDTGFGAATAVGFVPTEDGRATPAAADEAGTVRRYDDGDWTDLGALAPPVASIDGDLVAAGDGVHRIEGRSLTGLGLGDVRDVAATDGPTAAGGMAETAGLAATVGGVHRFTGGEWTRVHDGDATVVASDGERDVAVVDGELLERTDDGWTASGCPAADVADAAVATAVYAVSSDGRFCVHAPATKDGRTGWGSRSLGVRTVRHIAVQQLDS